MKRSWIQNIMGLGLAVGMAFLWACAGPTTRPSEPSKPSESPKSPEAAQPPGPAAPAVQPPKGPFSAFPEQYRTKALNYENKGELRNALLCWTIVSRFLPDDPEANKKLTDLTGQIHHQAEEHFRKGVSHYQAHSTQGARREFLLALADDPDHKEAREYLKNKLGDETFVEYTVKQGDTLREIARKQYKEPDFDFLIAYFNDLGKAAKPVPKTVLRLPVLAPTAPREMEAKKPGPEPREIKPEPKEMKPEPKESKPEVKEVTPEVKEGGSETKQMLAKAQVFFNAKNYRESISLSEEVLEDDPSNREAKELANASYYQTAKLLSQEKKLEQALEALNHVDGGYKDVKTVMAGLKKQLADSHYLRGVRFFTNEEIEKAIKEWESTLSLDPQHAKAKRDLENARTLLQKLKEIK